MAGCCVLLCGRGGSGVFILLRCARGVADDWGTSVLSMYSSFLRSVVLFYPRCWMGLDGVGFCRASVRSEAALVTASAGERLGKFFWTVNISVVSDTRSDAVWGM